MSLSPQSKDVVKHEVDRLRCKFYMVDEFQDTSSDQWEFISALAAPLPTAEPAAGAGQRVIPLLRVTMIGAHTGRYLVAPSCSFINALLS